MKEKVWEIISLFDAATERSNLVSWVIEHGSHLVIIVLAIGAMWWLYRFKLKRFFEAYSREEAEWSENGQWARTLSRILLIFGDLLIVVIGIALVFGELKIELKLALAPLMIAGLAIGLGAKNVIKDVSSGFFLMLENRLRVGDSVEVSGREGKVESLGLRAMALRDSIGNRIIIPNGDIRAVVTLNKAGEK